MNGAALVLQGIHKSLGGQPVLRDVSLRVERGEVLALIGASGSGKSTLLRCANLLEVPDSGSVTVLGEAVALQPQRDGQRRVADRKQLERVRQRVAMVFQSFALWSHMTALQNVIEGPAQHLRRPRAEVEEEARALLSRMGVGHRADAYPSELSGGQQQRVAIARALCMQPELILLDEPTSALDPESTAEVLAAIRGLAQEGRTLAIVTHELGFAREVAQRVVFLHAGRIEESGPADEVLRAPASPLCQRFVSTGRPPPVIAREGALV
jgi:octopine/nopaline transport system ATP-binding protein